MSGGVSRGGSSLRLHQVHVHARAKELLSGVSLELAPSELVALVGPNGAGKTTLLRAALGLVRPTAGHVRVGGKDVADLPSRERAAHIGWLPQHFAVAEPLLVLEVVVAARFRFDEAPAISEKCARAALERVNAAALANARITELSGGERQRVAMAALLAQESRLALLDEPASHLDPAQQLESYRLIAQLWESGIGVLLVTHDVNLIGELGLASRIRVVGLERGRIAFERPYDDEGLPRALEALFGVSFAVLRHEGRRVLIAGARGRVTDDRSVTGS